METLFFTPDDIRMYFKSGRLREELEEGGAVGVCSVADILYMTEEHKKGLLNIEYTDLNKRHSSLISESSVYISELDKDRLLSTLFEKDDRNLVTGLCEFSARSKISPQMSLRLLILKISDTSAWWSERVQEEMEQYHGELADNG